MWTTNVSPAADTGSPSAAISIPELSIATWPCGSHSTRKIAAGSAAIARCTSIRSIRSVWSVASVAPVVSVTTPSCSRSGAEATPVLLRDQRRLGPHPQLLHRPRVAVGVGEAEERAAVVGGEHLQLGALDAPADQFL